LLRLKYVAPTELYADVHFLPTDLHPFLPTFRSYGTIDGGVHFSSTD